MIEISFLIAYTVFFIHVTTWEGHIWEDVGNYLDKKLPERISKPLYGCPICMSFWWGFLIQFIFFEINLMSILITFTAGGINVVNAILAKWFQRMSDQEEKEANELIEKIKSSL